MLVGFTFTVCRRAFGQRTTTLLHAAMLDLWWDQRFSPIDTSLPLLWDIPAKCARKNTALAAGVSRFERGSRKIGQTKWTSNARQCRGVVWDKFSKSNKHPELGMSQKSRENEVSQSLDKDTMATPHVQISPSLRHYDFTYRRLYRNLLRLLWYLSVGQLFSKQLYVKVIPRVRIGYKMVDSPTLCR